MEIKKISEHKIRCALSEEEIQEMGFNIDEIIGDAETTQRFMRMVAQLVQEQGQIDMQHIAPMVKAELLQDHSMAITFGSDADLSLSSLIDTVEELMKRVAPEKYEELLRRSAQAAGDRNTAQDAVEEIFETSVPFALEFPGIDGITEMFSHVVFPGKMPQSSLYKYAGNYYLVMDFIHFAKEELRPLAFAVVEYNQNRFAQAAKVAYLKEHGTCIIENEALETLMQL